ncbi:hypothetical protein RFI_33448, partial [Reticulomyxa filosa]
MKKTAVMGVMKQIVRHVKSKVTNVTMASVYQNNGNVMDGLIVKIMKMNPIVQHVTQMNTCVMMECVYQKNVCVMVMVIVIMVKTKRIVQVSYLYTHTYITYCWTFGHVCDNGKTCITLDHMCDGIKDCNDASDECLIFILTYNFFFFKKKKKKEKEKENELIWKRCNELEKITWLGFILSTDESVAAQTGVYWIEPLVRDSANVWLTSQSIPGDVFGVGMHIVTYTAATRSSSDRSIFCNIPIMVLQNINSSQLQPCYNLGVGETIFLHLFAFNNFSIVSNPSLIILQNLSAQFFTPIMQGCYVTLSILDDNDKSKDDGFMTVEWMVSHMWIISLVLSLIFAALCFCVIVLVRINKRFYEKLALNERQADNEEGETESSDSISELESDANGNTHNEEEIAPQNQIKSNQIHFNDFRMVDPRVFSLHINPISLPSV